MSHRPTIQLRALAAALICTAAVGLRSGPTPSTVERAAPGHAASIEALTSTATLVVGPSRLCPYHHGPMDDCACCCGPCMCGPAPTPPPASPPTFVPAVTGVVQVVVQADCPIRPDPDRYLAPLPNAPPTHA